MRILWPNRRVQSKPHEMILARLEQMAAQSEAIWDHLQRQTAAVPDASPPLPAPKEAEESEWTIAGEEFIPGHVGKEAPGPGRAHYVHSLSVSTSDGRKALLTIMAAGQQIFRRYVSGAADLTFSLPLLIPAAFDVWVGPAQESVAANLVSATFVVIGVTR